MQSINRPTPVVLFDENIKALQVLVALEQNKIVGNDEDIICLKRYTGFGSIPEAFPNGDGQFINEAWRSRNTLLKSLLTEEEYAGIANNINNAYYTPKAIIQAMWAILGSFGANSGVVLDAGCGNGRFGLGRPKSKALAYLGVEVDSISARMANAMVRQPAHIINCGFQSVDLPESCIDIVIGNPPYGNFSSEGFAEFKGFSIHNQFILKGIQALKPQGYAAFVVSRYVMDSSDSSARREMAGMAELVYAYRLNETAFADMQTDVVTDILVFRKKRQDDSDGYAVASWVEGLDCLKESSENDPVYYNSLFNNDKLVAGQPYLKSGRFGWTYGVKPNSNPIDYANGFLVQPYSSGDRQYKEGELENNLDAIVAHIHIILSGKEIGTVSRNEAGQLFRIIEKTDGSKSLYQMQIVEENSVWSDRYTLNLNNQYTELVAAVDEAGKKVKMVALDGTLTNRYVYNYVPVLDADISARCRLGKLRFEKLNRLIDLRDLLLAQISAERNDSENIEINRENLRNTYQSFVKKYGFINSSTNSSLIYGLPDAGLMLSLELSYKKPVKKCTGFNDSGKAIYKIVTPESASEAAILSQRVINPTAQPTSANSPEHALQLSMAYRGRIDLDYMANLLDLSTDAVIDALVNNAAKPLMFFDNKSNEWVEHNLFLSGNIRTKLAYTTDPISIQALQQVMPEWIAIEDISLSIGMVWIPLNVYTKFIKYITDDEAATLDYEQLTNLFELMASASPAKAALYSNEHISLNKILESLLNNSSIRITKTVYDPIAGKDRLVFDPIASEAAISLSDDVKGEFLEWVYKQADLLEEIETVYNERFNCFVRPTFDGSHMVFIDKVPDSVIEFRTHQRNAIYRGVVSNFVLYDHSVGSGKTFSGIARAMTRKQLGLSNKPMIVVPNHLVEQFSADVFRLYPSANVLSAGAKDFEKRNRRRLFARMLTGNYDLIIVPHSSFEFIKLSDETRDKFIKKELEQVTEALNRLDQSGRKKSARALAEQQKRLQKALSDKINNKRNDRLMTFEMLGVDCLTCDEFHSFKNIPFTTRMRNVVGLGNPAGSNKAMDMFLKIQYLHEIKGSAALLTGTPISNSAAEMYGLQRCLQPEALRDANLEFFDNWAALFAENVSKFEATESGRLKQVTRFAREWRNMRALMTMWFCVADSVTNEDIKADYLAKTGKNFPIPNVATGGRQTIVVQPTEEQEILLGEVLAGFDALDSINEVKERNSERLRLMDRARKLSLAARCVDSVRFAHEEGGKLFEASKKIAGFYEKWDEHKGTQLVFLDRSVPKSNQDAKILAKYEQLQQDLEKAEEDNDTVKIQRIYEQLEQFNSGDIDSMRIAQFSNWSAYSEIKKQLVIMGVPSEAIRYIQEATTDEQKKDLFDLVRSGQVRVLIGSTARMGAGTNVQDRLVALHHIDIGWKPSDIEQKEGRIIRQGNLIYELLGHDNFEVSIFCYVTERSTDAKLWEVNANKIKMINSIRYYSGEHNIDFGDDADNISMKEIAALATGNPLMLERVELEMDIQKLERLKTAYLRKQSALVMQVKRAQTATENLPVKIQAMQSSKEFSTPLIQKAQAYSSEIKVCINDDFYSNYKEAKNQIEQLHFEKKQIVVNDDVLSFTKAMEATRISLRGVTPFIFKATGGSWSHDLFMIGEILYKRLSNCMLGTTCDIGLLAGLPVSVTFEKGVFGKFFAFEVFSLCGKHVIGNRAIEHNRFTVMNLASALEYLLREVIMNLDSIIQRCKGDLFDQNRIVREVGPTLNNPYSREAEMSYKSLRLSLLQQAMISDNAHQEFADLLLEHETEFGFLQERMNTASKAQRLVEAIEEDPVTTDALTSSGVTDAIKSTSNATPILIVSEGQAQITIMAAQEELVVDTLTAKEKQGRRKAVDDWQLCLF